MILIRVWRIIHGINTDLGQAAHFRPEASIPSPDLRFRGWDWGFGLQGLRMYDLSFVGGKVIQKPR